MICYDGYLTEQKLLSIMTDIFGEDDIKSQYRITDKQTKKYYIADIYIKTHNLVIEFDGAHHYQKANYIIRDKKLDVYCASNGIDIVHVPYWLQLDDRTLHYLFHKVRAYSVLKNIQISNTFAHGFISDCCVLPADYSITGWKRFATEYNNLFNAECASVMKEIYASIENKISKMGVDMVLGDLGVSSFTPAMFLRHYPT